MTSAARFESDVNGAWHQPATVRVALAGCGAVGSALVRELAARRGALADRHGVKVVLTRVLVRDTTRERAAVFDRSLLTTSVEEFLSADADVVIEAIGGIEPARAITRHALARGSAVVTANKELLAACGTELSGIAARRGASFRYDAAVGGGVPVLRLLADALGAGTPTAVRGILNGTTNYVLTRLEEGDALVDALAAARRAGFAEEDATRDLDGRDAAAKVALVAWTAFGVPPEAVQVRRTSLLPDPARFVRLADRLDRSVRQVAECTLIADEVVASVAPVLVERSSAFAATRDEQNRVEVYTGWNAPLCASGPGAGGVPTAAALLSDLLASPDFGRRGAPAGTCASDRRRSRWAVEVRGGPSLLHRHLPGGGVVRTDAEATLAWSVVDGVTPGEIDAVLAALHAEGAEPIAVRLDDTAPTDRRGWS